MIQCPQCGNDGSIQKVSAIWMAGTQNVMTSGPTTGMGMTTNGVVHVMGTTVQSGVSQTLLARRLAPPPMPEKPKNSCVWYGVCVIFPFTLLIAKIPTWIRIIIGILTILFYILIKTAITYNNDFLGMMIMITIYLAMYILGFIGLSKGSDRQNKAYNINMQNWYREMEEWNKLYYCYNTFAN